jgi:hypothetical protein
MERNKVLRIIFGCNKEEITGKLKKLCNEDSNGNIPMVFLQTTNKTAQQILTFLGNT